MPFQRTRRGVLMVDLKIDGLDAFIAETQKVLALIRDRSAAEAESEANALVKKYLNLPDMIPTGSCNACASFNLCVGCKNPNVNFSRDIFWIDHV